MPTAWYLCPYSARNWRRVNDARYCAMLDFDDLITADGGAWAETEVLGNHAIVKVRASANTLTTINAAAGFTPLTQDRLDAPLSDLTTQQKTAIRNKVLSLGYTSKEITNRFGSDLGAYTLRDVLRFVATRRLEARYDDVLQQVVLDGAVVTPRSIESVDERVL